ncbi:MAG TPA: hypothetical protein V6D47_06530 [Oscillatoriaceae cyanobacterium]
MGPRTYWATGLALIALAALTAIPRHAPTTRISLNVPDLDGDHHAETLTVVQKGADPAHVSLYATRGKFTHAMLDTSAQGPFTAHQDAHGFVVKDAHGAPALRGVYYRPPGKQMLPQLIVFGHDQARRYVWVQRGFLKLDAHTVIPGYSVGLLMLGDDQRLLNLIGTRAPGDRFQIALEGSGHLRLQFDKHGMIKSMHYADGSYVSTVGVRTGMTLTDVKSHYPGSRVKSDWVSPLYGLMGQIGRGDNVVSFTITNPWRVAPTGKAAKIRPAKVLDIRTLAKDHR